jgi:pseudouridylate synthase
LALREEAVKCSTRDLPALLTSGRTGATTAAATAFLAARAGIAVMATGGIGGVHRNLDGPAIDVSADLVELTRSPVAVVCSGAKAILDLPRTFEALESLGVPVVGYRCDELPAFYTAASGLPVAHRVDDIGGLAQLVRAQRALGLGMATLICNPPPADLALPAAEVERLVAAALAAAEGEGVTGGGAITPFLLAELARLSGGRTVAVNRALVAANARLAAEFASALAR